MVLDINDHIDPSTRDWLAFDDSGDLVREPEHEAKANALGLRFEAWLARQEFHSDQMRLLRMIEEKIKADAKEIEEWHIARFTMPPFSAVGGVDRAVQAFGGQEQLDRVVQSLNVYMFEGGWEDDLYADATERTVG